MENNNNSEYSNQNLENQFNSNNSTTSNISNITSNHIDYLSDELEIVPSNCNSNTHIHNNTQNPLDKNDSSSTINENNTSNCLALTIKEDYKLTSKTNVFLRSLRMSFKVFVSYVTLNIIKLFF